ncbi:MAG: YveK family protein [Anaerolineales bacterium]
MELRHYWHIIRRRLWIVIVLLAASALSYLLFAPPQTVSHTARMRFVVGLEPEQKPGVYTYDRYYTWMTAEYLIDDLAEVVKSHAFAQDVSALSGMSIPPTAIQGATASGKLHRILTVNITWPHREQLGTISEAIIEALSDHADEYFGQFGGQEIVISLIDPPQIQSVGPSLRQQIDLPLRLLLAGGLGIALTFFLDYMDDTIRHREDLEELDLPILGEIPKTRGMISLWRHHSNP